MSDTNKPTIAPSTTPLVAPKSDHQVAAEADYAEAAKILHQIIYDGAKKTILDPNTQPEILFIACLFFIAEIMSKANEENMDEESPDIRTYSFKDIPKVFSDRSYCMVLLSYYCLDLEMRNWWEEYYQPSNANTRQALFLQVQSYLDYLAEQHASGKITENSAMAYAILQP